MEAKVLAVVDVIEAMAEHRPYRPSLGMEKTKEELEGNHTRVGLEGGSQVLCWVAH